VSTSKFEIERIVRTHPSELKYLFKSPTEDKRRLTKIIAHLVPYRIGLEFECFGCLTQHLAPKRIKVEPPKSSENTLIKTNMDFRRTYMINLLKLIDFSEDMTSWTEVNENSGKLNEIRLSFMGYKQLIPLFNALELMNKYCSIPVEKGGIHIHVDYPELNSITKENVLTWFRNPIIQSKILNIFGGYKGTYNKLGASENKGYYVRVSSLKTIEFRIARLTYNYSTIIRWVIEVSKLVKECKLRTSSITSKVITNSDGDHTFNYTDNSSCPSYSASYQIVNTNDGTYLATNSNINYIDRYHTWSN